MPIIIDMRDPPNKEIKNRSQVTTQMIDSDLIEFEKRLQEEKRKRIMLLLEKYPEYKGHTIV